MTTQGVSTIMQAMLDPVVGRTVEPVQVSTHKVVPSTADPVQVGTYIMFPCTLFQLKLT